MDATNNRRRGALIGLAVGDALGATVEFILDFGSQPQEHALERKKQTPASQATALQRLRDLQRRCGGCNDGHFLPTFSLTMEAG
jgi:hypothetical protein